MSRSGFVRCITDNHRDSEGRSWCGQAINKFDFAFVSIEHAAFNGRSEGRLVACSECTAEIIKALATGQEES